MLNNILFKHKHHNAKNEKKHLMIITVLDRCTTRALST